MSDLRRRYGGWELVAGAALGLGESFCVALAKQKINIVMVDNQTEPLNNLSNSLNKDFGIQTITLHIDLKYPDSGWQIIEKIKDLDCRLLIYNAAFSRVKKFTDHTPDDLEHYLNINIGSQLKLAHSFSQQLINKKQLGGILLMSSLAGLLGMQLIAPYAASKAFTWNLAEALFHELKQYNIDVTACIAGATATEAYLNTNPKYGFLKAQVQQPEEVVKTAINNLGRRALVISGISNRINYFILTRIMPRKMAASIANRTMGKMYPNT